MKLCEPKPGMIVVIDPSKGDVPGNRGMINRKLNEMAIKRKSDDEEIIFSKWEVILTGTRESNGSDDPRVEWWNVPGWLRSIEDFREEEGQ